MLPASRVVGEKGWGGAGAHSSALGGFGLLAVWICLLVHLD